MSNTLTTKPKTPDSELHAAIEQAGRTHDSQPGGWSVFFEDREDLTVVCSGREGLVSTQTRQVGLSARGGLENARWVHLSDPGPDDVAAVLNCALGSRARIPSRRGDLRRDMGGLEPVTAAALVTRLEEAMRRALPRAEITIRWVGFEQHILVGLPGSPPVADCRRGARLRIEVRLLTSGGEALAVEESVLPGPTEPAPESVDRLCASAVSRVERRLILKDAPRGEQSVVFAPGVGGVLIHEIVGHALEADVAMRGSWLAKLSNAVAAESVVVVDDPRRSRAPWRIDDEGEDARAVPLVLHGRVRSWLLDRATSAASGRASNGHGRRGSFREPVRPRMGCTFLGAGPLPADEVLDGTTGIYVRRMESAHTDPASGRATFRVTDADALRDGRCVGPLRPHLLRVEGSRALSSLDRVANDLAFDTCIGSCHRDGQALSISVGAPTFRIGVVTVTA